ncbi:MAG: alpha/beta hydrolase [Sandarakinorhabdus sp.]|nr:alpha/beta hydrolase [Sandarakinorhabdus sp.]
MPAVRMIDRTDGVRLAVRHQPGTGPTILFLPGYMSDMSGTKAGALMAFAQEKGRSCLLFDYSGCGQSGGGFDDGSIQRWAADAQVVADALAPGPIIAVGSSMGGWIMLHLALAIPQRIHALVGIAAAPDFTRWGLDLTAQDLGRLSREGFTTRPSAHADSPYRYSRTLLEASEAACLLHAPIAIGAPIRLVHGLEDADVPWDVSLRLAGRLQSADVQLTLVKGGDHRLSTAADLALITRTIESLVTP